MCAATSTQQWRMNLDTPVLVDTHLLTTVSVIALPHFHLWL
jgi:hypothetical protein